MTKRIRVAAPEIWNVATGPDPGGNLEIFGDLYAWRRAFDLGQVVTLDAKTVFHADDNNLVNLAQGTMAPNNTPAQEMVIEDGEWLSLVSSLQEYDDIGGNDPLLGELKIRYRDIQSGRPRLRVQEGNQVVDVVFDLVVL